MAILSEYGNQTIRVISSTTDYPLVDRRVQVTFSNNYFDSQFVADLEKALEDMKERMK